MSATAPDARPRVRGVKFVNQAGKISLFEETWTNSLVDFGGPIDNGASARVQLSGGQQSVAHAHRHCTPSACVSSSGKGLPAGRGTRIWSVEGGELEAVSAMSRRRPVAKISNAEKQRAARAEVRGAAGRAAGAGGVANDHKSERQSISRRSDLRSLVTPPAWLRQAAGRTACTPAKSPDPDRGRTVMSSHVSSANPQLE